LNYFIGFWPLVNYPSSSYSLNGVEFVGFFHLNSETLVVLFFQLLLGLPITLFLPIMAQDGDI